MKNKYLAGLGVAAAVYCAAIFGAEAQSVGGNASLTAGTSSTRVALPVNPNGAVIVAPATGAAVEVFYALGNSTVAATLTSKSLPSGGICITNVGPATNIAAITASSTANVRITQITGGCPTFSGGSGGGGGGGAATIANGADVAEGSTTDTPATTPTTASAATTIALLKALNNSVVSSIPAGSNSIGFVGLNASSNSIGAVFGPTADGTAAASAPVLVAGTVDGTGTGAVAVPKVTAGGVVSTDLSTVNAVTTLTGNGTTGTGSQRVTIASDNTAFSVNAQPTAAAAGGASPVGNIAANNTTAVVVKSGAGTLYSAQLYGIGSAPAYLKIYNATSATCGSGTPVKRLLIPAASTAANGAGNNVDFGASGVAFGTGITYCVTTGIADADTTAPAASTFIVNLDWK